MGHQPASSALEGLTVLDLTHVRAGPTCVRHLADWGANVVKIERPGNPADFAARPEADFQNKHRNKRSIALNLRTPKGRAILMKMAETADIIVENFRPDVKSRLGIDYDAISAVNPKIIYASISAFGQEGPYRDRPGVDQVIQGMSGLMSVTGEPGRGPMRVGIPIADLLAGTYAAMGIFVALCERHKSGKGQWVQTSLLESQVFMLDLQAVRYLVEGVLPKQVGNEHPTGVPTNLYQTRDGYVNIAPLPAMWPKFCEAIGRPEMVENPEYKTREARRKKRDEINAVVRSVTSEMTTDEVVDRLLSAEIPCGPVYTIEQLFADPQTQHMRLTQPVKATSGRDMQLLRQPFSLSRTPSTLVRRTPEFAEHTNEVLAEFGISEAEIQSLREAGAVE